MTAGDLLRELEFLRDTGVDLEKADLVVRYTVYDPSIAYDMGVPAETYPESIEVENNDVYLFT